MNERRDALNRKERQERMRNGKERKRRITEE